MPYDEVYFQRLEQDNPEDYEKTISRKRVLDNPHIQFTRLKTIE